MPAVFFFLIDVSMNALQTGATAAACSAINQVIADLPVSSFLYLVFVSSFCIWIFSCFHLSWNHAEDLRLYWILKVIALLFVQQNSGILLWYIMSDGIANLKYFYCDLELLLAEI